MVARALLGIVLVTLSLTSFANLHVVEFRRTFSAPDCSTGEVIVDGSLKAFFFASPALFESKLENEPIVADAATSEVFSDVGPYLPKKLLGATLSGPNGSKIRLVALDESSYWQYERPRKKARTLPQDVILLGTRLNNRECTIRSSAEDEFYESNFYYAWPSNILAASLFEGKISRANYLPGTKADAIVMLSDSSSGYTVAMAGVAATFGAARDANNVAAGDACLTKLEHMSNTIVKPGGTEYRRRDDVWFCTDGVLAGASGKTAMEAVVDLRYWTLVSDEICATMLGLPLNRLYLVTRGSKGNAAAASTRCVATDPWTDLTDKASVTYK